ncbi:MAG TPA: 6-phosphogluconolactonase [Gemmatimonadota bacterium]|nr:6-phosphogluconolactonase [Gemmatimonadota bacterium]
MTPRLTVHSSVSDLHDAAAARFVSAAAESSAARGRFDVLLTGGSTIPPVYEKLAAEPLRSRVAWDEVHVWWTDERCVPPDDPRSNYGVAREALLDRVPIPCEQIHRMPGEDPNPERAAVLHEATLRREQALARGEMPYFDFAFLGLGGDAHVASLFPRAAAIGLEDRLVAAVLSAEARMPDPAVDRLTLTLQALNGARAAVFVVAGAAKAAAVRSVLEEPRDPALRPAQGIAPAGGDPEWILDRAATADLR